MFNIIFALLAALITAFTSNTKRGGKNLAASLATGAVVGTATYYAANSLNPAGAFDALTTAELAGPNQDGTALGGANATPTTYTTSTAGAATGGGLMAPSIPQALGTLATAMGPLGTTVATVNATNKAASLLSNPVFLIVGGIILFAVLSK